MTTRMVTYRVKDGRAEENAAYVRDVMADLAARRTEGVTYSVYLLDDGVTFLHVVQEEGDGGRCRCPRRSSGSPRRCSRTGAPHARAAHDDPGGEVRRDEPRVGGLRRAGRTAAARAASALLPDARVLHDAEDAVQETLLRGWRGVDRFEGRSSLRTWLYTVATNVCLREIERRGRRLVPVDLGPSADPADGLAAPLTETVGSGRCPTPESPGSRLPRTRSTSSARRWSWGSSPRSRTSGAAAGGAGAS